MGQPREIVDFEQIMMDVMKCCDGDFIQPYVSLNQAYATYLLDDREPQLPGYFWGILSCLSIEEVTTMSASENEEEFRAARKDVIAAKLSFSEEFRQCMMPFVNDCFEMRYNS